MKTAFLISGFLLLAGVKAISQTNFAQKCEGNWKGMMYIYQTGQLRDSVEVTLLVKPESKDVWTWRLDYLSKKLPMTKDYKMKFVAPYVYNMDEGEGLELRFVQHDNKLYSIFEVQKILLTSTYELTPNNTLILEVSSGTEVKVGTSTDVRNFQTTSLQKVVFKKPG